LGAGASAARQTAGGARGLRGRFTRAASTACAGMCWLTNRLLASRAELANFAALPFGFRVQSQKLLPAHAFAPGKRGGHDMCEHVLPGKLAASAVCRAKSFRSPINRV